MNEKVMYQVKVQVFAPMGIFNGIASGDLDSAEEAQEQLNDIQAIISNECDSFTFYSSDTDNVVDGAEITIASDTIKNSVFVLSISSSS